MQDHVFKAGAETIFNVDVLRAEQDQNFIDGNLLPLVTDHATSVLSSLSRLLVAYAESVRKHRGTLFGQGSHQSPGTSLQLSRKAALKFYVSCELVLDACVDSSMVWQVRLALLRAVHDQALYIVHDGEAEVALRATGDKAFRLLKFAMLGTKLLSFFSSMLTPASDQDATRAGQALVVLTAVAQIDYDMLSEGVHETLSQLLMVRWVDS